MGNIHWNDSDPSDSSGLVTFLIALIVVLLAVIAILLAGLALPAA